MLKALIKKQFSEIFKSYFVNPKTGKARGKGKIIGLFVLFAVLMLFLCGIGFMLAAGIGLPLFDLKLDWLYFAIMTTLAIIYGLLGSVFNTFSGLYLPKDNELILSMPIPTKTIIAARITSVFGLSLLYSSVVYIPACIFHWIFGNVTVLSVVFDVLLTPIIAVFVTVLTCALGFLVALISTRLKNKSFITVILSLAFFGIYYFVCFRLNSILTSFITNSAAVGQAIKKWGNVLYQIGMASCGNVTSMLVFTALTAVLAAACIYLLSKTFLKIATLNKGIKKTVYKEKQEKQNDVKSALLKRELKRFTSSATYMLNCALGVVILPVVSVIALIKKSQLNEIIIMLSGEGDFMQTIPVFAVLAVCLIGAMNAVSTPSISLEGKNLWIIKSLPVSAGDIFDAKRNLHILITAPTTVLAAAVFGYCVNADYATIIIMAVFAWIFVVLMGDVGLVIGIKNPNFNWTNEVTPIKQSLNQLLSLVFGSVLPIALGALYYFLKDYISSLNYLIICVVLLALITRIVGRWIKTKGVLIFENF